jgi:hypothetical protein
MNGESPKEHPSAAKADDDVMTDYGTTKVAP